MRAHVHVAVATMTVIAGVVPAAPVVAQRVLPTVGECYNLNKRQDHAFQWKGGTQVGCSTPHDTEIFATVPLPGVTDPGSEQALRAGIWACRMAQMEHGRPTLLNGLAVSTYTDRVSNPDGSQSVVVTCGARMYRKSKMGVKKTTVLYQDSDKVQRWCILWGKRPVPGPCSAGKYVLTRYVDLDPTFTAPFPGAKWVKRSARAVCGGGKVITPLRKEWKYGNYALCWRRI